MLFLFVCTFKLEKNNILNKTKRQKKKYTLTQTWYVYTLLYYCIFYIVLDKTLLVITQIRKISKIK